MFKIAKKTNSPFRRRRFTRFVAPVVVTGLALGAVVIGTAGNASAKAHHRPPDPVPATTSGGDVHTGAIRTVRFRVVNATDQILTVSSNEIIHGRWRGTEEPTVGTELDAPDTENFNIESTSGEAAGWVKYRIGSTPYWARVYAYNPFIGSTDGRCEIQNADGKNVPSSTSGYQCEHNTGSGNDVNVDAVIEPTTAATHTLGDASNPTRRDAVDGLCSTDGSFKYASCKPEVLNNVDYQDNVSKQVISPVLVNCGSETNSINVKKGYTVAETNTIGVATETQIKLSEAWTQKVIGSYSHSWTTSRSDEVSTNLNVPTDRYGWLTMSPAVIQITGNYTLKAGNQTYNIGNFTINQPADPTWLAKNNKPGDQIRAEDFPMSHALVCGGGSAPFEQDQPASILTGAEYTIAAKGANQWGISVLNRSHGADEKPVLDSFNHRRGHNQDWLLRQISGQPEGDYQIVSSNTPTLCLDTSGGTNGTDIVQHACKASSDSTLANQVWRVQYDPTSKSFRIVQPATGKVLARSTATLETGVTFQAASTIPTDGTANWVFSRVS